MLSSETAQGNLCRCLVGARRCQAERKGCANKCGVLLSIYFLSYRVGTADSFALRKMMSRFTIHIITGDLHPACLLARAGAVSLCDL